MYMSIGEMLDELALKARKDPQLKEDLKATRLAPMDLLQAGEEAYAAMRRSTNGGGENSPLLEGEDDYYEMFFAGLEE